MASVAEYDLYIEEALMDLSLAEGPHDQAVMETYDRLRQRVDDGELLMARLYAALAKQQQSA
jgi:hypothetical protein